CCPTSAPGGIRTRDLLADNEASTPDCSTKASSMAQEGVEPSASLVLSESSLPIAYRAGRDLNPGATTQGGSRTHRRPGLSRAARPLGVPGRLAAEAVGLEPTSGPRPQPVFKTGPSSGRMASVRLEPEFRGLESNQRPPRSERGVTTS